MKALIIAAGDGSRLQPFSKKHHKTLIPLLGLKIIERVILGAKKAGIYEFVIVIGYKGKELRKVVGDGKKYGVSIKFVENNNWEVANGISVLAAKDQFKENFVLLMGDHIFDWQTLIEIQRLKLKGGESVLAIDRNLSAVNDPQDATKVDIKNGVINKIGKNLTAYNAYDTGMFICSPEIFTALGQAVKKGKKSLSSGMAILAEKGKLRAFDIKDRFWADCDTYADLKFARKNLLNSLTKPQDGFVSKRFNRKISTFITRFLVKTPITPNIISFALPLLVVPTVIFLAQGTYPWVLIGGILIQLLSILDGCDGEIARLKFKQSEWGGWLDPIIDRYIDAAIIAGMAYGFWNVHGDKLILPIAIFMILLMMFDQYIRIHFRLNVKKDLKYNFNLKFSRDIRSLLLAVGAMTNQILPTFLIYLAIFQYRIFLQVLAGKYISEGIGKKFLLIDPLEA